MHLKPISDIPNDGTASKHTLRFPRSLQKLHIDDSGDIAEKNSSPPRSVPWPIQLAPYPLPLESISQSSQRLR